MVARVTVGAARNPWSEAEKEAEAEVGKEADAEGEAISVPEKAGVGTSQDISASSAPVAAYLPMSALRSGPHCSEVSANRTASPSVPLNSCSS
eukprot:CAMPEP_0173217636 /NCGR_PEP_ID=MMETSP1142-20121109/606_1 /TAXON_ID=483371 /ORGANISM="non described non described, Strain CCMP2298" /LENGTH=92 /DNA_ID=CAMNT_0014145239 /DNA_START=494 /DNA_END=768 /DNA_ORIENTATION=+